MFIRITSLYIEIYKEVIYVDQRRRISKVIVSNKNEKLEWRTYEKKKNRNPCLCVNHRFFD